MQRQRVIAEHKRCIDQEVERWEEKHQVLASEVDLMEECQRKSIVVVFGLEEKRNEGYMDTVEIIPNFLKEVTKPDVLDKVYFASRGVEHGGGGGQTGIRSITCGAKVQLLRNGGQLRVCNISIEEL